MIKWLLFLIIFGLGVMQVLKHNEDTVKRYSTKNTFSLTESDSENPGEFVFKKGNYIRLNGYVYRLRRANGSVEHLGTDLGLDFINATGLKEFIQHCGGKLEHCSNRVMAGHITAVRLIGETREIADELHNLTSSNAAAGEPFSFLGYTLSFHSGQGRSGRPLKMTEGRDQFFLVTAIEYYGQP